MNLVTYGHVVLFQGVIETAMESPLMKRGPFCSNKLERCEETLFLGMVLVLWNINPVTTKWEFAIGRLPQKVACSCLSTS